MVSVAIGTLTAADVAEYVVVDTALAPFSLGCILKRPGLRVYLLGDCHRGVGRHVANPFHLVGDYRFRTPCS